MSVGHRSVSLTLTLSSMSRPLINGANQTELKLTYKCKHLAIKFLLRMLSQDHPLEMH